MKSDLRKSQKNRGKGPGPGNKFSRKGRKKRGIAVRLLWCAAAAGLKPLSLPRAQTEVNVHLKNAFPGGIAN